MSQPHPSAPAADALRRLVDVTGSLILLILASPLMLAVAILVATRLGRPVLFRQRRAGRGENGFDVLKFRTMRPAATSWDPNTDAQRLTPLGQWLRRWSLDELPQLVNILRGDMSFVGPRPLPVEYLPRYLAHERPRHDVRPGLTGLAQVRGRNGLAWDERLQLDAWYARHRTLALDARILVDTVRVVFSGRGVSVAGGVTMTELPANRVPRAA